MNAVVVENEFNMAPDNLMENKPLRDRSGTNSIQSSVSSFSSESNCSLSPGKNVCKPSPNHSNSSQKSSHMRKHHGSKTKFKLILEGDIQVCRLNHTRTIISKIMNSKYLRRWECHHLLLGEDEIKSTTPVGFMDTPVSYSIIEDINIVSRWDAGHKFCIRITIPDGSLLIQAHNLHLRDQWLHSLQWKRNVLKYEKLLTTTKRPEVLVKEIRNMIEAAMNTPVQDESVSQFPLELVSLLLQQNAETLGRRVHEEIIFLLAPLLEKNNPTQEICDFFSKHCRNSPRSAVVLELFTPVVHRILKHCVDFGKYPRMRSFIQEFIQALSLKNDGAAMVKSFVNSVHGQGSSCPHPRVLPNMVAVCLAAVYNCYEDRKGLSANVEAEAEELAEIEQRLLTYTLVMSALAQHDDWRLPLGSLIQPLPFPEEALGHSSFTSQMKATVRAIGNDPRCDVHQTILSMREGKDGWFNLYCPGAVACDDDGELFGVILTRLMSCCSRRKTFLSAHEKMLIQPCLFLALRAHDASISVLCAMLEFEIIESSDMKMQIITTLQSSPAGKRMYAQLCERQIQLRELQQKGGPRKLTLPSKSTDQDLSRMLSSGSFGNLECLSLAFTQVTNDCARDLIKLPSLRYLNLWSTQFGDAGLQLLSEHLHKLQVLNLCETRVTDKGLVCLSAIKSLRRLNLNSTKLSAITFEEIKEELPALQEADVRYTEAW